jgi:chorismate lyase / 3-hydroxybenzoate synthase
MSFPSAKFSSPLQPAGAEWDLAAPQWAIDLVAGASSQTCQSGLLAIDVRSTADVSLVSVRIPNADKLSAVDFERAITDAYIAIADRLKDLPASHPVRFWNYIPDIHAKGTESLDRYMVFNAGRYTACQQWLGGEDAFPRLLATASGVGHAGADFVIHALGTAQPGVAVENPRQVPAYRYSRRYGPKPPCFARATVVPLQGRQAILVGGTASVRGEESVFVGDVRKQVGETLDNLAALLQAATGDETAGPHLFKDVRVYLVKAEDEQTLKSIATAAFSGARIEYVQADICRQDLLVEIEGVA